MASQMQLALPMNQGVLAALGRRGPGKPEIVRPDDLRHAYLHCGCHPDIVERLWDELGAALPQDCRQLVFGTPALVHPQGLILAVGIGTQYGLRVPAASAQEAAQAGAPTVVRWSGGSSMDIRHDYGEDWVFGGWLVAELQWCQAVFRACEAGRYGPSTMAR